MWLSRVAGGLCAAPPAVRSLIGTCSLADTAGAEQVDYITRNGWTPCLEFSEAENAYVKDNFTGAQTSACARSCFWRADHLASGSVSCTLA